MKLFILLLILAAFIQSSFLPLNLCLILIICQSFVEEKTTNYFYAFFGGIFLSLLTASNLGFWALIFIFIVKLIHIVKKLPITANFLTIIPLAFGLITLTAFIQKINLGQSFNFTIILLETLLIVPAYFFIRFWEDRFVVKGEIKLKIKS